MGSFMLVSLGSMLSAVPAIAQSFSEPSMSGGLHGWSESGLANLLALINASSIQQLFADALRWLQGLGLIGALVFMGIYILATIAFLPGSILTLGAGVVFGVVQGSVLVFIGASLGAIAAFLVGRYLARGWVAKMIEGNRRFKAVDEAVGREGLKIVILTRLSPVFPFNVLNYAFGLTGVSLRDYAVGCLGMLPGTIMYVYLGSLAGDLAMLAAGDRPENAAVQLAIQVIGFAATAAVTIYVTRVASRAFKEAVPEADADSDAQQSLQSDFASELSSEEHSDSDSYSKAQSDSSSAREQFDSQ